MARGFNGVTDRIAADSAYAFSQTSPYSVALWVNGAGTTALTVMYGETNSASNNNFFLLCSGTVSGRAAIFLRGNSGTSQINRVNTSATVLDSTFHHFAYAQDAAGNWNTYVDGAGDASGSYTAIAISGNQVRFGHNGRGNNDFFAGVLAEIAVFHRQLSAGEAASLGLGLPASHLGPDHYWPLWGADSPEPDIGNSSHTAGTLTGTTAATGGRVSPSLLVLP